MGYGRKNRFPEWVGSMYGTESAMFHKMVIFKARIDFVLGFSLLTSRESIPRRNLFSQEMDYVESMPGVHKNLKIRAHRALLLVKAESPPTFCSHQVFAFTATNTFFSFPIWKILNLLYRSVYLYKKSIHLVTQSLLSTVMQKSIYNFRCKSSEIYFVTVFQKNSYFCSSSRHRKECLRNILPRIFVGNVGTSTLQSKLWVKRQIGESRAWIENENW